MAQHALARAFQIGLNEFGCLQTNSQQTTSCNVWAVFVLCVVWCVMRLCMWLRVAGIFVTATPSWDVWKDKALVCGVPIFEFALKAKNQRLLNTNIPVWTQNSMWNPESGRTHLMPEPNAIECEFFFVMKGSQVKVVAFYECVVARDIIMMSPKLKVRRAHKVWKGIRGRLNRNRVMCRGNL